SPEDLGKVFSRRTLWPQTQVSEEGGTLSRRRLQRFVGVLETYFTQQSRLQRFAPAHEAMITPGSGFGDEEPGTFPGYDMDQLLVGGNSGVCRRPTNTT